MKSTNPFSRANITYSLVEFYRVCSKCQTRWQKLCSRWIWERQKVTRTPSVLPPAAPLTVTPTVTHWVHTAVTHMRWYDRNSNDSCNKGAKWFIFIQERESYPHEAKLSAGNSQEQQWHFGQTLNTRFYLPLCLESFKTVLYRPLLEVIHFIL